MRRFQRLLALSSATLLIAGVAGPGMAAAQEDGGSITVRSLWGGAEQQAFQEVLDAFQEETGITATYESVRDEYATVLRTDVAGGNPPDVAIIPGIGFLRSFAGDGSIVRIEDLGIDTAGLEGNYPPGLLDVGRVDGDLYALMVKFNTKSSIWYDPSRFEEMGVEPAEDWDGFMTLLEDIRGQGRAPLALGAGDSWTLTDWFESIYVRQAGPEMYDQLFSGELPWTDESVVQAIETMQSVLNDENVAGGITASLGRRFVDDIAQVFTPNPDAEMVYEGGFVGAIAIGQVNPDLEIGETIDWFPFPSIDGGDAVTIGGDVIAALTDDPGVAEFVEWMTTPAAGEVWASTGAIISPIIGVDTAVYPNELVAKEAEQVANASAVRFDGSDLLPAGMGDALGAVLQSAIQGQDIEPLLEGLEQQVATGWEQE
jgi:alpha-glucoside transport system substrate-binding protein